MTRAACRKTTVVVAWTDLDRFVFILNPTASAVTADLPPNLYRTGLTGAADAATVTQ